MTSASGSRWERVKRNPTYLGGALSELEGQAMPWHLHSSSARSSQVFCISAFGTLRRLPDGQDVLQALLTQHFPDIGLMGPWRFVPEYSDRNLLGETGRSTPTSVDVFCKSTTSVVCIESKFVTDAREGFGSCSQFPKNCRGFHGSGSDAKTGTSAACRLEVAEGSRGARLYWRLGSSFFRDDVFAEQEADQECPFRGSSFQLMRNVLFAASSSAQSWATMAIVPNVVADAVREQMSTFQDRILRPEYRQRVAVATYETMIELLLASPVEESRGLGRFLAERIATVCAER